MEPNKLENQIKEKLNSREIPPSAKAWDRLDAMLSVAEEKKTRRHFGWMYIAASISVLLAVGMFFFSQKNAEIQPENKVVRTEVKKDPELKIPNSKFQIPKNEENIVVVPNPLTIKNQRVSINNQKSAINNQQASNQNPLVNRDKEIEFQNSSDLALKDLPKIETSREIVISNKNIPSDEQLLASLDITATQSSEKNTAVKMNPKALLSQVDGELELTFREKVINKVSKNYKEVKVALANRNNE